MVNLLICRVIKISLWDGGGHDITMVSKLTSFHRFVFRPTKLVFREDFPEIDVCPLTELILLVKELGGALQKYDYELSANN